MLLIRQTVLRRHLSAERYAALEAAASSRLLPAGTETLGALTAWLTGLLTRTHGAPEMLRRPAIIATLETELVTGLSRMLSLTDGERREPLSLRRRGFDRPSRSSVTRIWPHWIRRSSARPPPSARGRWNTPFGRNWACRPRP